MTEEFVFRGHLCIVMELLSINLYELIKANSFVGFTTALIRRFTSQMLLSLQLMRQYRIVHCDLKPEVRNRLVTLSWVWTDRPSEYSIATSSKECVEGDRLWQQLLRTREESVTSVIFCCFDS